MVKTKWNLLFATFILSCISLAVLIVSLCTPYWITSEAYERNAYRNSEINYGLFVGSLTQNFLPNPRVYDLEMTCLFNEYVCALSCQETEESRTEEVLLLLQGRRPLDCPMPATKSYSPVMPNQQIPLYSKQIPAINDRSNFINAGVWISTVVFLGIAIAFASASVVFSILNVLFNPVEPLLGVFGLYIWNGTVIGSCALAIIMWGALFGSTLTHNIAVTDTLTIQIPYSSTGLASLGASYWALFLPILLHGTNIGLLAWRRILINKEPPPTTIDVDRSDLTIIMY